MISKVYLPQGAKEFVVDSGGRITIKDGGRFNLPYLTPQKGSKASLVTGDDTDNNKIAYASKIIGEEENGITVSYVLDEEAKEVEVLVHGKSITVICEGEDEEITTKASEVVSAIGLSPDASMLVTASGDGEGEVEALEPTNLEGGKDTTPARKGDICFDSDNLYIAKEDILVTDSGDDWHSIKHLAIS